MVKQATRRERYRYYGSTHREMASCSDGLTTHEALTRLHEDISIALEEYQKSEAEKNKGFGQKSVNYEAFHRKSYLSVFRWTSALALIVEGIVLLVAYAARSDPKYQYLPAESFFIFAAVVLNVYLVWWDTRLRHKELPHQTQNILRDLKEYQSTVLWSAENYPHLHSPLSPCITLQWTLRDGNTVNLPWSLLVRGDVIFLKPGQKVPAKCRPLQDSSTGSSGELHLGDIYSPSLEGIGEGFSSPKARTPLKPQPHLVLETPYITNLKIVLAEGLNRPITVFNKQRFLIFSWAMETVILPVVVVLMLIINILRVYYGDWVGHWSEVLLIGPVCVALPLIPLGLPLVWLTLNWLGIARILTMYHHAKHMQSDPVEDPFEDAELEALHLSEISVKWVELRKHFLLTALGKEPTPIRTANVLHVLASVTNLCCVDKKGVLSWPNPTAEKVFFLKNRAHNNLASSVPSLYGDDDLFQDAKREKVISPQLTKESESVLMSLTHDHQTAFGLQFDDPMWRRYLLSLKPLGLNILLNTCNPATQDHYTRFCSHITCEAMYNEDLVPVSQRRCLCELAKQIGFSEQAQEPFELEHQLSTFRHVPPDMACKDRLAKSLMITKLKFPFPHMVSVLMRDRASRKLELMSQGTADIILDSCTDYWDGYDICPLTEKDRKKILDFYHRTSLSAYCTAFSYRPTSCVVRENLSSFYMELPIDPSHLYNAARTPTPHISTVHIDYEHISHMADSPLTNTDTHAEEALFGDEEHTEYEEIDDIDDAFRMQCKQIFIGMVTMQYQAKTDMVQMIEQLDLSCIRFVHFSKENELRSRVFSEKMGLESGWNCHISLLSDRTRTESGNSSRTGQAASVKTSGLTLYRQSTEDVNSPDLSKTRFRSSLKGFQRSKSLRKKGLGVRSSLEVSRALSHSAPSAINLDVAQVKFDEEVSVCSNSSQSQTSYLEEVDEHRLEGFAYDCNAGTSEECIMLNEEDQMYDHVDTVCEQHSHLSGQSRSRSPSRVTDSTEHSTSFNFDMSNRARLPKGIENIKPHLENVDNVPLLVSLFTDCTPPATRAMLTIMQEYTEVVMVMGSSANADNIRLFMQADASLSVDPLYPQVCMREAVFVRPPPSKGPSPTDIARILNSLPCSLSFHRDDKVSLVHLIMESRHYMQQVVSCLQFWSCCCVSLTILQLLAATAALPPLLSSGDVVWLVCVVIPILSVSLVAAPTNPAVMNQATGKNSVVLNKQMVRYVFLYYICKFVPSVAVILLCGGLTLESFCRDIATNHSSSCTYIYPDEVPRIYNNSTKLEEQNSWKGWGDQYLDSLNAVQNGVAFLIVLYFCTISVSFVHRMYQLWRKNPLKNRWWASSVFVVLVLQVVYGSISASLCSSSEPGVPGLADIPPWVWLIAFVWPLLVIPLNEVIKRREIRVNVRYQKRARLEFGTKLGMNSPF
ncbi:transmembrane protein 94-like isoform X5 [Penaeus japonicus]|uniref:transmembrane protein 94-like isoform X5 n=1 Tax=Penaeus japonicus TaxID=27405 RepID=UPI001C70C398|nr:transmembrane protein 94-like isoform X5 [Penaeus japonicus]